MADGAVIMVTTCGPDSRAWRGRPMTATESDVYYDPFDFEIDTDPYPI